MEFHDLGKSEQEQRRSLLLGEALDARQQVNLSLQTTGSNKLALGSATGLNIAGVNSKDTTEGSKELRGILQKMADRFDYVYEKRMYCYRYMSEGMEMQDFENARDGLDAVIKSVSMD